MFRYLTVTVNLTAKLQYNMQVVIKIIYYIPIETIAPLKPVSNKYIIIQ